jgi:hypothetical protein
VPRDDALLGGAGAHLPPRDTNTVRVLERTPSPPVSEILCLLPTSGSGMHPELSGTHAPAWLKDLGTGRSIHSFRSATFCYVL